MALEAEEMGDGASAEPQTVLKLGESMSFLHEISFCDVKLDV